ncbi:MAG: hypothetical protein IT442_16710 [Phycisphaeraceae bacterium]|nr:hypothetical protein [Phycisphaeraceae bacterium]
MPSKLENDLALHIVSFRWRLSELIQVIRESLLLLESVDAAREDGDQEMPILKQLRASLKKCRTEIAMADQVIAPYTAAIRTSDGGAA